MNKTRKMFVALACAIAFFLGIATGLGSLQYSRKISNTATLKTVGINVFQNVNLTTPATSINWGMLEPGQTKNSTVYLQSTSNVPITLSIYTANWNPANASRFLTLTWDYKGQAISPSGALPVTFSLAVNASMSGISSFSFDIWIVGSG